MANDWTMPRRADACSGCGRVFEPGEVQSVYLYADVDGYVRRDRCGACPAPEEGGWLGAWRARRPEPRTARAVVLDVPALLALFEQLEAAEAAPQRQLRFALGLLLWRRKALRLEDAVDDADGELWRFSHAKTGASVEVRRPPLDDAALERVSMQLESLIAGATSGFDSPHPTGAAG